MINFLSVYTRISLLCERNNSLSFAEVLVEKQDNNQQIWDFIFSGNQHLQANIYVTIPLVLDIKKSTSKAPSCIEDWCYVRVANWICSLTTSAKYHLISWTRHQLLHIKMKLNAKRQQGLPNEQPNMSISIPYGLVLFSPVLKNNWFQLSVSEDSQWRPAWFWRKPHWNYSLQHAKTTFLHFNKVL